MPRGLVEQSTHRGLTELHVVEDMHERKTKMAALADWAIALPGGAGTLEGPEAMDLGAAGDP